MSTSFTVGKLPNGKFVQILRVAECVAFSPDRGWVLTANKINDPRAMNLTMKWIPASTRFEWVRTFNF